MKNIKSSSKKAETLIELIVVLFLISLILFEMSAVLKNFVGFSINYEDRMELEDDINLFFSFMENDFKLYNTISVKGDSIYFENKNKIYLKTCEYYLYNGRVKRVAGGKLSGNTYFLNNVESINFIHSIEDNFLTVKVKIKDKEYKKIFSTKDLEVIEWRKQVQV